MVPRKILLDECVQQAHIPLFPDCFKVEGVDKPLYVMGGKRSIAKITKGLPPNIWEEVPQDYMTEKYSRRYM